MQKQAINSLTSLSCPLQPPLLLKTSFTLVPPPLMNTCLLSLSPPPTSSRSSNSSLTPLSPRTQTTLSIPQSPSLVDWMLTNQWWCGQLPPPPSCLTPSTCPTTHLCRQVTQRYAYPVPPEDHTAQSSTNRNAWSVSHSAKNLVG